MKKAEVSEFFFSLQGEGPYLGVSQVFIRFSGCNIKCRYCDTQIKKSRIYDRVSLEEEVKRLLIKHGAKYVSLTGGEPLLQADFIRDFLEKAKFKKELVYLETNGILYKNFARVRDAIDIISMDIKLPTSTGAGEFWQEHAEFLRLCRGKKTLVKAVITLSTKLSDLKKAIDLVSWFNKSTTVVLQLNHLELNNALIKKVVNFQQTANKYLDDVRVMPQLHKILGVR